MIIIKILMEKNMFKYYNMEWLIISI